jgi:hypothetical protein
MRWLWLHWSDPSRPWIGSDVPCSADDRQLFRASTVVSVGNGQTAHFWHSTWLTGVAPIDLAPDLFKLAWRKNNCVAVDLSNDNWTRGLWRMTTAQEMAQFINLWELLQEVQLTDASDTITWRWTEHGSYTAKSAYLAQFRGSYTTFNSTAIWKAHTEGKRRLFAWLLIQCKIMTADRLAARNIPCNLVCVLCDQLPESAAHLCLDCVYARQVWELVFVWTEGRVTAPARNISVEMWWNSSLQRLPRKEQSQTAAVLIYTAWSLRKERNRRVRGFQVTGNSFPTHAAGDEAPTGPLWGLELFLS